MSFKSSMESRYSTKMYDKSKNLSEEQIEELKEILRLSPSSLNSQPWNFSFVLDTKIKAKLSEVSQHNTDKVNNCHGVVVFSRVENIEAFEADFAQRLPKAGLDYYNTFVKPLSDQQKKTWFEKQVYLALGVFLSACAQMNIDSTPMEGIEGDKYDAILKQNNYKAIVAVAIGQRDIEDFNQLEKKPKSRKALEEVVQAM